MHRVVRRLCNAVPLMVLYLSVGGGCTFTPYVPTSLEGRPLKDLVKIDNSGHRLLAIDDVSIPSPGHFSTSRPPAFVFVAPGPHTYTMRVHYHSKHFHRAGAARELVTDETLEETRDRVASTGKFVEFSFTCRNAPPVDIITLDDGTQFQRAFLDGDLTMTVSGEAGDSLEFIWTDEPDWKDSLDDCYRVVRTPRPAARE